MIQKLEQALFQLSQLSETEQEAIATLILAEIEAEKLWTEAFANSEEELSFLADEALNEFKQGKTCTYMKYTNAC
ncbi:MAG: hypothetical protein SAJ37_09645 [Oscillatoria sp. PMC 1068.18]|nr:hypothetical protein [Oscillatoria sp. PMC 1076.18]MEC4988998.1 hypothetical protein [Oscillatoria sp. PMC 1068.18]